MVVSRTDVHFSSDESSHIFNIFEKITQRLQDGENIDLEHYMTEHPECADELRRLLPTLKALAHLGDTDAMEGMALPSAELVTHRGVLGDFRILREIGRGGMGVVYEAEQISLGRRVALKILPFAAVLDDRQLQRFKNEAQAAGLLRHPNIVAVHGVGVERGVHYYAMELIVGQSLAELIAHVRRTSLEPANSDPESTPTLADTQPAAALSTECSHDPLRFYRSVVKLVIQAAEALDYAHQEGVVHRDVKPANLLIDNRGKLWITDFGLAQVQREQNLTMTGELLGTIRYMSPEQVEGKKVLDERTDVYSLGITLYELITLKPAFSENARQRLIRKIEEEDPPRLRHVAPAAPRDLETIVHKAIEKEPHRRYQTAQGLADDLDRLLENRPIKARPSTAAARVIRWCGRNPLLAGLTAAITLLCVLVIVLAAAAMIPLRNLVLQQVATGNVGMTGRISPDGRYLSYANWASANIAVRDLESEGVRDVTDEGAWWDQPFQYGESSVWSPDGNQLAFSWTVGSVHEIRITSLDAGASPRTVYRNERARNLWTFNWCKNLILIEQRIHNGPYQLVVIDTEDGTSRIVKQFDEREPTNQSRLSPDERYVVFVQPLSKEDSRGDLYLLNINTGETKPLTTHPADDDSPTWTPDSRWIVFVSDRRGRRGMWAARIRDGQLVGEPRFVYEPLDVHYPLGFSREGDYFFGRNVKSTNLYEAELDFSSAAVTSPPTKIQTQFDGATPAGDWSPDGQLLAYLSRGRFAGSDTSIHVRRPDGSERKMLLSLPFQRLTFFPVLRWTSDGTSLLIRGGDGGRDPIFFRVDADTGHVDRLARTGLPEANLGTDPLEWEGMLYYVTGGVNWAIMRTDLVTQQQTQLYRARSDGETGMNRLSPNGKLLAYVDGPGTLRVFPVDGDTPRTVYTVPQDEFISSQALAWSRDARFLLFGSQARDSGETASVTLWQIPASGGGRKATGIVMTELRNLRVHPDNKRILFTATDQNAGKELWVLKNLLAKLNAEAD